MPGFTDYEVNSFPDGQINVAINDVPNSESYVTLPALSYKDLFVIKSFAEALDSKSVDKPGLYIPCLMGQRSDRRFAPNESFDLKVIADFINSCDFPNVGILDPHSDVALALINRSNKIPPDKYIRMALGDIMDNVSKEVVLVSPDAGAYKKVFQLAEALETELVAANKFRDKNGDITLNVSGDVTGKNCLIVDDLADGGYTFHLLAKRLKGLGAVSVDLYVTHGYFHKGFDLLASNIDQIYTTDSVRQIDHEMVIQYPVH